MSPSPSSPRLSLDTLEPVDPAYLSHPLSSTDLSARENSERECIYGPGHSTSSQLSLTINAVVDNNTYVRRQLNVFYRIYRSNGQPSCHSGQRPSTAHPVPDPFILTGLEASACICSISRDYPPHELIPLIEDIFTREGEVKMLGYLGRDAAQAFIDVVHEVRPAAPHFCGTT